MEEELINNFDGLLMLGDQGLEGKCIIYFQRVAKAPYGLLPHLIEKQEMPLNFENIYLDVSKTQTQIQILR